MGNQTLKEKIVDKLFYLQDRNTHPIKGPEILNVVQEWLQEQQDAIPREWNPTIENAYKMRFFNELIGNIK